MHTSSTELSNGDISTATGMQGASSSDSKELKSLASANVTNTDHPATLRQDDWQDDLSDDDRAVFGLRNLIFDVCNHNGGGHGGSAVGMSAIGVALYKYTMRYNPLDSEWFDRDRFVLSNGKI